MKRKITALIVGCILILATGCGNSSTQDAPELTMPESASIFADQDGETIGYNLYGENGIEEIWSAFAIDQWQSSDEDFDDSSDSITLDYETPFVTKITLNTGNQVAFVDGEGEGQSTLYYQAPEGSFEKLAAAVKSVAEIPDYAEEVTLEGEDVNGIIQEIIDDETLKASDGETNNIDCSDLGVKEQLSSILPVNSWSKIEPGSMPQDSDNIAFFFTDQGNSLVVESDGTYTYLTLSYHEEMFGYYQVEGDLLTPISELLETIK